MYKTGVWLNPKDYAERKKEQKELQLSRKNEFERHKIVHDLVDSIIKNVIKKQKEAEEYRIRNTKYIRPKLRFINGKRIR